MCEARIVGLGPNLDILDQALEEQAIFWNKSGIQFQFQPINRVNVNVPDHD
jgi:hypothetical protein